MTGSRNDLRSLPGWPALSGERALAFRTLARQRRIVLPATLGFGLVLDVGVPVGLLVAAPSFAWTWAVVGLLGALATGAAELALERDHHQLRMAPVSTLPALLWLAAVPAAHRIVSVELSWLFVLLAPDVPLEELFFLLLLCYTTMNLTGFVRPLVARRVRRSERRRA